MAIKFYQLLLTSIFFLSATDAASSNSARQSYAYKDTGANEAARAATEAANATLENEDLPTSGFGDWRDQISSTPGQDVLWAQTLRNTDITASIKLKSGLSGAQQESCAQSIERNGAWLSTREALISTLENVDLAKSELNIDDTTEAALDLIKTISIKMIIEGDRNSHAFTSILLTSCVDMN